MYANLEIKRIVMSKTEAIAAGKLNSEKFNELRGLREMYPTFEISVVKSQSKKANRFKGLDCKYMEQYIKAHDEDNLAQFYALRGLDEDGKKQGLAPAVTFGELKVWFLESYPEIIQKTEEIDRIIEKAKEKRAARKQTA